MRKFDRILTIILAVIAAAAIIANAVIRPDRHAGISIIYTSNIQGNALYKSGENAGYEKIAAIRTQCADESDLTVLIDSGGCLGASAFAEENSGKDILALMDRAGYSAMCLGNADYVYGTERLRQLSDGSGISFLAANIVSNETPLFEEYIELNADGLVIMVTGVCDSLPAFGTEGITITDASNAVSKLLSVRTSLPDIVIVLANLCDSEEVSEIAAIKGVDFVIDGRRNDPEVITGEGKADILSVGCKGTNVGVITIEAETGRIEINNRFMNALEYDSIRSDAKTASMAADAFRKFRENASSEHTNVLVDNIFVPETEEDEQDADTNRPYETGTGDIIADAVLYACSQDGAEAALIPNSFISRELSSGSISKKDIIDLFPDDLHAVTFRVTGGELRDILEDCFSGDNNGAGFCQVAGLSFTYSPGASLGTSLSDIYVNGEPLDDGRTYIVAGCTQSAISDIFSDYGAEQLSTYKSIAGITWQYIMQQFPDTPAETADQSDTETDSDENKQEPVSPERIIIN